MRLAAHSGLAISAFVDWHVSAFRYIYTRRFAGKPESAGILDCTNLAGDCASNSFSDSSETNANKYA